MWAQSPVQRLPESRESAEVILPAPLHDAGVNELLPKTAPARAFLRPSDLKSDFAGKLFQKPLKITLRHLVLLRFSLDEEMEMIPHIHKAIDADMVPLSDALEQPFHPSFILGRQSGKRSSRFPRSKHHMNRVLMRKRSRDLALSLTDIAAVIETEFGQKPGTGDFRRINQNSLASSAKSFFTEKSSGAAASQTNS